MENKNVNEKTAASAQRSFSAMAAGKKYLRVNRLKYVKCVNSIQNTI